MAKIGFGDLNAVKSGYAQRNNLGPDSHRDAWTAAFQPGIENQLPKVGLKREKYRAKVLRVVDKNPYASSFEDHMVNNLELSERKTFYVVATIDLYDFLPEMKKENNDLINMREQVLGTFKASMPKMDKPQKDETVWVTWRKQDGDLLEDFEDPIYLGRVDDEKPRLIENTYSSAITARDAFLDITESDGLIPMKSKVLGEEPKLTGRAPSFKSTTEKRFQGALMSHDISIHEIYINQKIDYPDIKKIKILPVGIEKPAIANETMYRKNNIGYFLPEDKQIQARRSTSMFILRESGTSQYEAYNKLEKFPLMHYNIVNQNLPNQADSSARSIINVNIPYGLTLKNSKDSFSNYAVGCVVSSPLDGNTFLDHSSRWDNRVSTIDQINASTQFANFKQKFDTWIKNKQLPDGSEAFIMGPYGTPGLRTGPSPNQTADISSLTKEDFWKGKLVWMKWGHYFLPDMKQAAALYELVSSVTTNPPGSPFSWGLATVTGKNLLQFDFPAVGGGDALYPSSNYMINTPAGKKTRPGFPWGHVGSLPQRGAIKPQKWWLNKLLSDSNRERKEVSGVVAQARWKSSEGVFLEYYLLARNLGLSHKEAWYVTLAAASQTYSHTFGGIGFGPSPMPTDLEIKKLLRKGQRMWFLATTYMRKAKIEAKGLGGFSRLSPG